MPEEEEENISRRKFGKVLGLGTATGAGMLMFGGNASAMRLNPDYISMDDSDELRFGAGNFRMEYNSSQSRLELVDASSGQLVWYVNDSDGSPLTIANRDLEDGSGNTIYSQSNNWVPTSILEANTITIGNTSIGLGGSGTPEADNLGGNNGTSGQVLQTDGSNTSWVTPSSETVKTISSDYTTSGETTILLSSSGLESREDDFESGSSEQGWEDINSNFSIDANSEIYGTYSLQINNTDALREKSLISSISTDGILFELSVKPTVLSNNASHVSFELLDSNGNTVETLKNPGDGSGDLDSGWDNSLLVSGAFSNNTVTDIQIRLDFTNQEYDIIINGTEEVSNNSFRESVSSVDAVAVQNRATGSIFYDDLTVGTKEQLPNSVTLSSTDASDSGKIVRVKDTTGGAGSSAVTIDTESGETIDGSSSISLDTNYGVKQLQSDGTNWFVISDG